jgi:phage replication O-like protein O
MASPQKENGYTPIASELLDAMCRLHLSGNEWSFVHALIRRTYGFHKKEDWITNTQISKMTGMGSTRVSEVKKSLISLEIVTENRNKISLQKDYLKWGKLRKTVTKVTENRNSELRKTVYTIDSITIDNNSGKPQQKNMGGFNRHSDNDDELPVIGDDGEVEKTEESRIKEQNDKVTALIEWAEKVRRKKFIDQTTQRKMIHDMRKAKISPYVIKKEYLDLLHS